MLYIILAADDADSITADDLSNSITQQYPDLRSEWYWDDSDIYMPTEYGVKVTINPDHHSWEGVLLMVSRLWLSQGGKITFEVRV